MVQPQTTKVTVIIAAIPRSGSSLVCKIFVAHGLWVGRSEKNNQVKTPTPYDRYENLDIDQWFRDGIGNLPDLVDRIKPDGSRLVYKCSPTKALIVADNLYRATLVKCHRKFASILKSSPDGTGEYRHQQLEVLDSINAPSVDVDAVMARDFTTLAVAMEHCGIKHDAAITEAQIDDSLWHYR